TDWPPGLEGRNPSPRTKALSVRRRFWGPEPRIQGNRTDSSPGGPAPQNPRSEGLPGREYTQNQNPAPEIPFPASCDPAPKAPFPEGTASLKAVPPGCSEICH